MKGKVNLGKKDSRILKKAKKKEKQMAERNVQKESTQYCTYSTVYCTVNIEQEQHRFKSDILYKKMKVFIFDRNM